MNRVEYFDCNNIPCDISGNHIVEKMLVISWNSNRRYLWHLLSLYRLQCPEDRANSTINTNVAYSDVCHQFCQHIHGLSFQVWCSWLSSHFFSSSFKPFQGLPRFVLKGIFTWYFSTNFLMTSAFLRGLFGKWLSAWDRLRWSVYLLLNELSGLEEHWPASSTSTALFSLFCILRYRSLTLYCSYFIGFSFYIFPH